MDRFRVVITLSHRSISMEYRPEGGDPSLRPVMGANWPAPLAVYCSPDGIVIGAGALQAYMSRQPEAYYNLFSLIRRGDQRFTYKGEQYEMQKLLLVVVESYLTRLLSETLFCRYGTLEANRADMTLVFVLEGNITQEEKVYLRDLFRSAGYGNLHLMDYDSITARHFAAITQRPRILVVWSDGYDLAFSLHDGADTSMGTRRLLVGKGRDPRLQVLTDKMWEDIAPDAYYLRREDLQESLEHEATLFLSSGAPEKEDVVNYGGNDYSYFINQQTAATLRPQQTREIRGALAAFLEENGCTHPDDVQLVLCGDASDNDYFASTFSQGFTDVLKVDDSVWRNVKDHLAGCPLVNPCDTPILRGSHTEMPEKITVQVTDEDSQQTHTATPEQKGTFEKAELSNIRTLLVEIRRKYRNGEQEAAVSKLSHLRDLLQGRTLPSGRKEERLYREIQELRKSAPQLAEPGSPKPPIMTDPQIAPPPPLTTTTPASELSGEEMHELKELLAQLRAKFRMGDIAASLQKWKEVGHLLRGRTIPKKMNDLYKRAEQDITEARRGAHQAQQPASKRKPVSPQSTPIPAQATPDDSTRELLKAGKFAEAKRQYAHQGDSKMAAFCGDLIRGHRNFMELKFAVLDERNRSNPKYAKNACSQLEAYIALLRKADISQDEAIQLLQEYKNPK